MSLISTSCRSALPLPWGLPPSRQGCVSHGSRTAVVCGSEQALGSLQTTQQSSGSCFVSSSAISTENKLLEELVGEGWGSRSHI